MPAELELTAMTDMNNFHHAVAQPSPCAAILRCPVCSGAIWRHDTDAGDVLGLTDKFRVLVCDQCGLGRLDPQPTAAEIQSIYGPRYFASESIASEQEAAPLPDYARTVALRLQKFEDTLQILRKVFPNAKNFLDVGAATGEMVKLARSHGFDSAGVELSEYAVAQALALNGVMLMRVGLRELGSGTYDLVHMNHVFEHFVDPTKELREIRRILNEGGGLYLEVPFQFTLVDRLKLRIRGQRTTFSLHSIHHPFFYTPGTLRRFLEANQFTIERLRLFSMQRYLVERPRSFLKAVCWWLLSCFGVGNFIEVIARKASSRSLQASDHESTPVVP